MATSVRLDDGLVQDAQVYASAEMRFIPKQIEHWVQIGRIAEDNLDLSYEFIKDALIAAAEINAGKGETYVRRERSRT
jgi:hypothetical protein